MKSINSMVQAFPLDFRQRRYIFCCCLSPSRFAKSLLGLGFLGAEIKNMCEFLVDLKISGWQATSEDPNWLELGAF